MINRSAKQIILCLCYKIKIQKTETAVFWISLNYRPLFLLAFLYYDARLIDLQGFFANTFDFQEVFR